jgi:hypothetical protein
VDTDEVNDPDRVVVRAGPVRSGSARGRAGGPPSNPIEPLANSIVEENASPGLVDWVPTTEPSRGGDYPIEGGIPHPHWVREPAEHRLASARIPIDASAAMVRLLVALAIIAFLLGMTVFYPVSPLGH